MRNKRSLKTLLQYESLIIPALLLYIIFCGIPFFHTFYYSLTNYNKFHINDYIFIGFENFVQVFNLNMLKVALINSIKYALLMTLFQSLCAIPLAVFLNKKLMLKNLYRMFFFLPAMFSPLVVGFLWQNIMGPSGYGLINNMLSNIGLKTFPFLDSVNGLNSIIFTQVWQWTGWAMVIYLANIQTISDDIIESARIDGAGELRIFFSITLPHLHAGTTVVVISSLVGGLKVFDIIQAMTKGGPGYSTETIMGAMINVGFSSGNYALASAFGVIFFALVMAFSSLILYLLKIWERRIA